MNKYKPLNRKEIIILICIFLVGVGIMELTGIIQSKDDANIDKELLLIIERNKEMQQSFGSFRGSNIEYFYNPSVKDTASFKAVLHGSRSHINFIGHMAIINKKWQLVTYSMVSDSSQLMP
ncbi:hypothetical protein [Emticicia sp. C21]|uniref:hypothetical protein n=1 Tax=Emticicia sp. C21 TaxID=2302915 RepID=UPI000E340844|nr:hypothetical protein [Emticicia sp. C21]RFS17929.1 hypothetical protein D0T08_01405 [Emticicia sp. C21]